MRLQTPDGFTGDVHINGQSFVVDDKGQVEIPPEYVGSSLWAQGFIVAKASFPEAAVEAAIEARQPKSIANEISKDKAV
jgi:hypothetical protein